MCVCDMEWLISFFGGMCSYEHHSIDEPAILLGGAFVVDVAESAADDNK